MLIRSSFHDYYDGVAQNGVDRQTVYVRAFSTVCCPRIEDVPRSFSFFYRSKPKSLENSVEVRFLLLGFCGQLYPGAEVRLAKQSVFIWNYQELKSTCAKLGYDLSDRYSWWSRDSVKDFFENKHTKWNGLFQLHRVPIFKIVESLELRQASEIHLNPNLGWVHFQAVKDPYSAFQDIYSFLTGVLGTEAKPMVKLSDKEMAKKRGHDGAYSFRRPPGTKKPRKKGKK